MNHGGEKAWACIKAGLLSSDNTGKVRKEILCATNGQLLTSPTNLLSMCAIIQSVTVADCKGTLPLQRSEFEKYTLANTM